MNEFDRTHMLTFIFGWIVGGAILMTLELFELEDFFTAAINLSISPAIISRLASCLLISSLIITALIITYIVLFLKDALMSKNQKGAK